MKEKKQIIDIISKAKQYLTEEKLIGYNDVFFAGSKDSINKVCEEVNCCTNCHLYKYKLKYVCGEGNTRARVIFVGEGPGFEEDRAGRPFVGPAGQLLTKIIESIGLKRDDVYIANIVKCHPMINPKTPEKTGNDRPPSEEEIESCIGYLFRQIELIKPEIIVTLGNVAAKTLLETVDGITKLRGRIYKHNNMSILPTFHPSALLRNPELKKDVWIDMKTLKNTLKI